MWKFIMVAMLAAGSLTEMSQAKAAELAFPLWACKLSADVQDHSFALIAGITAIEGNGVIHCRSLVGQKDIKKNVVVRVLGVNFGPQFQIPTGETGKLKIWSAEVGVSSVEAMSGEFSLDANLEAQLADVRVQVARDVRATPAIPNGGISTGLTLSFQKGGTFGIGLAKGIKFISIMTQEQARATEAYYRQLYQHNMDERNLAN